MGLICVSFQSPLYRQTRDIRVREVPEMEFCLVYCPSSAEIYRLNPSAWFVFRMCEERTEEEIARAYHAAMEPVLSLAESAREVRAGLESLLQMRIIEPVVGKSVRAKSSKRRIRDAQET
jgi:Coenzyme PQQ synthesis protein D (PqqD)